MMNWLPPIDDNRVRGLLYGVSVIAFLAWIPTFGVSTSAQSGPAMIATPVPEFLETLPAVSYGGRNPFAAPSSLLPVPPHRSAVAATTGNLTIRRHMGPGGILVPDFGGGVEGGVIGGPQIVVRSISRVEGTNEMSAEIVVGQDTMTVHPGDRVAGDRVKSIVLDGDWQGIVLTNGRRIGLNDTGAVPQIELPSQAFPTSTTTGSTPQSIPTSPGIGIRAPMFGLPANAMPMTGAPPRPVQPVAPVAPQPDASGGTASTANAPVSTMTVSQPDATQGTPRQLMFPQLPVPAPAPNSVSNPQ